MRGCSPAFDGMGPRPGAELWRLRARPWFLTLAVERCVAASPAVNHSESPATLKIGKTILFPGRNVPSE
jgi:hypothetical protein